MKILSIDDMLAAALDSHMPDYISRVEAIEKAASELAESLAIHLKIEVGRRAEYERDFGGTCATFRPACEGQKCPAVIQEGDPQGDWE